MADRLLFRKCYNYSRRLAFRKAAKRLNSTEVYSSTAGNGRISFVTKDCTLAELEAVQDMVTGNLEVHENFISEDEQRLLLNEIEPYLKRQRYQYDHWDGAIHGYRETEKSNWTVKSLKIFKRMKDTAFRPELKLLPHVHVLDLAQNGYIKPHIDSVKFCGSTIAGLSLVSPSVMRLIHEEYSSVVVDALLPSHSMYILRDVVRYKFTHEVLSEETSRWRGEDVPRDRRISVILRCQP